METPGDNIEQTSFEVRNLLCSILTKQLQLYRKTKHFQDTIGISDLFVINKSFSDQIQELNESISEVRNRLCGLGYHFNDIFTDNRELLGTGHVNSPLCLIKDLLEDHEALIGRLYHSAGQCEIQNNDMETSDLLTGLLKKHEMVAWTLRKYLNQF
jgi:starvation-inducible DNA-binding protein